MPGENLCNFLPVSGNTLNLPSPDVGTGYRHVQIGTGEDRHTHGYARAESNYLNIQMWETKRTRFQARRHQKYFLKLFATFHSKRSGLTLFISRHLPEINRKKVRERTPTSGSEVNRPYDGALPTKLVWRTFLLLQLRVGHLNFSFPFRSSIRLLEPPLHHSFHSRCLPPFVCTGFPKVFRAKGAEEKE